MTDRTPGFRRDATVLLRYWWFVAAVFAIAIIAALALSVRGETESQGRISVEIWQTERQPVYGSRPIFSYSDYRRLTSSDEVADEAAAMLASQNIDVEPGTLRNAITSADTTPPDMVAVGARRIEFTATTGDESAALAYADAWAAGYVKQAAAYRDSKSDDQIASLEGQIEAAAADLDSSQRALEEFLDEHPDVPVVSPARLEDERGRVTLAIARLEAIQASGGATPEEAQIALAGLFPSETLPVAGVETLVQGFGLRLAALDKELAAYGASDSDTAEARALFLTRDAAEQTYRALLTQVSAARALKPVAAVEFRVPDEAVISTSRQLGVVGLFGVAAAFGLAVGTVGAFAIEFLVRNGLLPWGQRSDSA